MDTLENYRFEIPVSELSVDPDEFRRNVTAMSAVPDAAERQEIMQHALDTVRLVNGLPLVDVVYEAIDEVEGNSSIDQHLAATEAKVTAAIEDMTELTLKGKPGEEPDSIKANQDGLEIEVSPDGEMTKLQYVKRLPLDKKATKRSQRISDNQPYGPTGNVIRISGVIPRRRIV